MRVFVVKENVSLIFSVTWYDRVCVYYKEVCASKFFAKRNVLKSLISDKGESQQMFVVVLVIYKK